jgi:predicted aconitase with swiveling domain
VLAESIRLGTAPAAIVLAEPDPIIVMGALVARELYEIAMPVLQAGADLYPRLRSGDSLVIRDGELAVS